MKEALDALSEALHVCLQSTVIRFSIAGQTIDYPAVTIDKLVNHLSISKDLLD